MLHLNECPRVRGLLQRYDIVALTHTGTDSHDTALRGFQCIHALTRPHDPESGGVAVFVKQRLVPHVTLVRHHAELSMLWLRISHDRAKHSPTYICTLYLPHQRSSYYRHVDQESHWQALHADAAEFAAEGAVMVVGDWNARVGRESDLDTRDVDELAQLHALTGIPVPHTAVEAPPHSLPARSCMDRSTNAMGRRLLGLCRALGLVVMNGRLPGDKQGAWTFHGPRASKSMIDIVVATPQLAFAPSGAVRKGVRMHVTLEPARLPDRPVLGGRFDHVPVGIRFRPAPSSQAGTANTAPPADQGPRPIKWRWRPELQEAYITALQHAEVQRLWGTIASAGSADEAVSILRAGLDLAVGSVHASQGKVVCTSGRGHNFGRPTNQWFDAACARARSAWKSAVRLHGHDSPGANVARVAYRAEVRRAKRAHVSHTRHSMLQCLYDDPRQFWRRFQAGTPQGAKFSAQEWSAWFQQLLSANTSAAYEGGSVESHCRAHSALFPDPSDHALQAAAWLNDHFTEAEISSALAKLPNHKSAGVDGIPAEFLTQASIPRPAGPGGAVSREFVLAPVLTDLCNKVMDSTFPSAWQISALAPVPKPKGRPDRKDDHRGIAVGPVVGKLYALAWTARLDKWAESAGLRARGQAGFRAGRGTPEQCFILRHLIDSARVEQQPLYCAFIDFSKAYDRVDRQLLLRILRGCGLHGRALHALAAMIEVTRMQVRTQGALGDPFQTTAGVRQGCPASPVLFGILIDRLEAWLEQRCAQHGVRCTTGSLLRALLFADDVVLTCASAQGLQAMLDALHEFCLANSMFVSESKSEVVVFSGGAPCPRADVGFTYNGASLPVKDGYLYLGLWFRDGQSLRTAVTGAVEKARKALYGMFSRCHALKLHNVNVQCHLFDTLVRPLMCYGCEVWAVDWLADMCRTGNFASGSAEELVHKPFLRQSLGVCKSTPVAAMYQDLGRYPVTMFWLRMAAQLWNRALARPAGDWLRMVLDANVDLACNTSVPTARRQQLWGFHFTRCMELLGLTWRSPMGVKLQIDCKALVQSMMGRWRTFERRDVQRELSSGPAWAGAQCSVRCAPDAFSKGFKAYVYDTWFAPERWRRRECWAYHLHEPAQIRAVAQFRLGSHWLEIQRGRCMKPRVGRRHRVCPTCTTVEDELHLLECPSYADARTALGQLPNTWTDSSIKAYFNKTTGPDWLRLAYFLESCRRTKMHVLSLGMDH